MLAFANAKINLGLNIIEKRADGYHDIETVFYPIKLYDVVEITDAAQTHCILKGIQVPGREEDNLCLKAFNQLRSDFDLPPQQICLLKNIPIGAGLGGGSSDAAFILKLVNEKFNLGLSILNLQNYARKLGADCAFFIENKPSFAMGKGDEFESVKLDLSSYFKILVKPPVHISTAHAYANLSPAKPSSSLKDLIHLPIDNWRHEIKNDFETSVFSKCPEVEKIKDELYLAGATFALMSGSGSSVYAIFKQEVHLPQLEKENKVFYNV